MKYIKKFEKVSQFEDFKNSSEWITPNVSYVVETKVISFEPYVPDMRDNYLTIEALEDGLTASLYLNACEYCVDGDGNWKTLAANTATESINSGHTLSFRGELTPASYDGIGTFTISKKCNLKGNCMSMLFGDDAANNYSLSGKNCAFCNLFASCTNIVNVSENFLPATTLSRYCYYYMFSNCTSLTTVPELPATTLANCCYSDMFSNCTSLTTALTVLPATTLASHCYSTMFYYCKNLTTAPELPATTLASNCYSNMFFGCTKLNYIKALFTTTPSADYTSNWVNGVASAGTFVKNKNATWNITGAHGIPSGWTVVNDGEESGESVMPIVLNAANGSMGNRTTPPSDNPNAKKTL